jgi:hypothetical protein
MSTLANSLKRIWSARNGVPHLTGWGTSGSRPEFADAAKASSAHLTLRDLIHLARRTAPTIFIIACNILR